MSKKEISKEKFLHKLNSFYCNRILPQVYDDSLSFQELLYHMFCKINEVIDTVNSFEELLEQIQDIIDDIDKEIRDVVEDYLRKLFLTGELKRMVEEIIGDMDIESKTSSMDLSQIAKVLHLAHKYQSPYDMDSSYDLERFSYAQGNTVFKVNGQMFWAVCYVTQNGSHFNTSNNCDLFVYRMTNAGREGLTMQYVNHHVYNSVGHANSLCYVPSPDDDFSGWFAICSNSYAGDGQRTSTDIQYCPVTFDTADHNMSFSDDIDIVTIPTTYLTTDYRGFYFLDHINYYDGKIWVMDGGANIYTLDNKDDLTPTLQYTNITGFGYSGDGMAITPNYIYIGYSKQIQHELDLGTYINYNSTGSSIARYNRITEEIDWVYTIPRVVNNHMYKCGEIEGFTIIDDVIYVLGTYNLGSNQALNTYNITRFFRQNIKTNDIAPTNGIGSWWSSSGSYQISLYVSGPLPQNDDDPDNHSGLRLDYAFRCLQEALDVVESCEWYKRANISVNQRYNVSPVIVKTSKPITISGTYYYNHAGGGTEKPMVGHIEAIRMPNIQIDNLCFQSRLPDDLSEVSGIASSLDSCLYLDDSNASITGCYFPVGLVSNDDRVSYAISCPRSFVNFYYTSSQGPNTTEEQWMTRKPENPSDPPTPLDKTKFINAYNSTVNGHGLLTTNANIIA